MILVSQPLWTLLLGLKSTACIEKAKIRIHCGGDLSLEEASLIVKAPHALGKRYMLIVTGNVLVFKT